MVPSTSTYAAITVSKFDSDVVMYRVPVAAAVKVNQMDLTVR